MQAGLKPVTRVSLAKGLLLRGVPVRELRESTMQGASCGVWWRKCESSLLGKRRSR